MRLPRHSKTIPAYFQYSCKPPAAACPYAARLVFHHDRMQSDIVLFHPYKYLPLSVSHRYPTAIESKLLYFQNNFFPIISQYFIHLGGFFTHKSDIIFHSGEVSIARLHRVETLRLIIKNLNMQSRFAVDLFSTVRCFETTAISLYWRTLCRCFISSNISMKKLPPILFLYSPLLSGSSFEIFIASCKVSISRPKASISGSK